ncbi:MAG: EcsC family protein [Rhodoferax sp.]|uniref:EcsC family protein n=1 Tax=Rhodoferax sp. TaxID=50421 RepID=UPI0027223E5D|nr:EcsC family protein [Rhodoferax sp.]MDO8448199.1 EcsC family protein [Rhodoferax sp.]
MTDNALATLDSDQNFRHKVGDAILDLVLRVPASSENEIEHPEARARALGRSAARQASLMAGSMALPPGFLGWLTILPELMGVWKLQAQMVSDIAAVYGKSATLGREQMVYCLFKHVSAQLFRDVVVRVGERFVIQRASLGFLQSAARTLGVKVTQKVIGKSAARFVPLIGAVGVGAYAYFDTTQVAKTAIELFSKEIVIDSGALEASSPR